MVERIKMGYANCYLVSGEGGSILVDSCNYKDGEKIFKRVKDKNVKLILLTHCHFDHGMKAEHYIISSGLKEIIEGTEIAGEFEQIYAAEYCYDDDGVPCWPSMAVNYTSKTQFLYRINKGIFDVTENDGLNEFMPANPQAALPVY